MTASTALVQFREELAPMRQEFGNVLPSHISPEKLEQVTLTAVQRDPDLLNADRQSLLIACMNAATDGLLPDKREGAFVIFKTTIKVKRPPSNALYDETVLMVQWMPMIRGLLKLAQNSGKVSSISVEMVHKNDVYRRAAGDDAVIVHEPLDFGDRGEVVGGYAIVNMLTGGVYREVMSKDQIESVRKASKATGDYAPWKIYWEEMAKKTILRRLLKRVPMTPEFERALSRDDHMYGFDDGRVGAIGGPAPGLARKNLFSGRVAKPGKMIEQALPVDVPPAEQHVVDAEAKDVAPSDPALVELVAKMTGAETLGELAELIHDAQEAFPAGSLSDEDRMWLDETVKACGERLKPTTFQPSAIISSTTGEKTFDDPAVWVNDLLTKMSALKGEVLTAFWKKNLGFVLEAGENGLEEQAEKILAVARDKHLPDHVDG